MGLVNLLTLTNPVLVMMSLYVKVQPSQNNVQQRSAALCRPQEVRLVFGPLQGCDALACRCTRGLDGVNPCLGDKSAMLGRTCQFGNTFAAGNTYHNYPSLWLNIFFIFRSRASLLGPGLSGKAEFRREVSILCNRELSKLSKSRGFGWIRLLDGRVI